MINPIGAIGFGKMSDNMGRKPCLGTALLTSFFGMFLGSFAPSEYKLTHVGIDVVNYTHRF